MSKLTAALATVIDRMNSVAQKVSLGTRLRTLELYSPFIYTYEIAADATGAPTAFTAPYDLRITDIIAESQASESGATVTPIDAGSAGSGTDAMCTAIACAADGAVTHMSAGADNTHLLLSEGDVVKVDASHSTVRGFVTFIGYRVS